MKKCIIFVLILVCLIGFLFGRSYTYVNKYSMTDSEALQLCCKHYNLKLLNDDVINLRYRNGELCYSFEYLDCNGERYASLTNADSVWEIANREFDNMNIIEKAHFVYYGIL